MSASPVLFTPPQLPPASQPEIWISYGDALRLCRRTRQWMHQQMAHRAIRTRVTDRKLQNGRKDREVLLSTLPQAAQNRYLAEQMRAPAQPMLALLPAGPKLVDRAPRVRVPAGKTNEVDAKHHVLEPILQMQHEHHRRAAADMLRLANGTPVDSQNRMIQYQIEQAAERGEKLSERTIKRWIAAHKQEGIAGLARSQRKDAGRSRFFSRTEHRAAAALVAYLHLGDGLTPGLSAQACHDMLHAQRELVGLAPLDLPCYETVRLFLSHITPALQVFARKGRQEFGERMLPYLSRAYAEHANQIWVSDHMIADVEVMNDCIPGAPKGAPIRLRLTAIIDYRSRFVVGYSWAWEGSSASIARALRFATLEHGPCELWYCDNGKDYCKVAAGAVPGYMRAENAEQWVEHEMRSIERTGVLARLGMRVTHCLPHHPQSKHVERFFRTVHLTFCRLWPTYTGGKPSERPDNTAALMAVHRKALREGDLSRSHHPLASELMARFDVWLQTYHAKRGHRGRGMAYGSPAEVFAKFRNPNQRPAPSAEELVWLLWDHTTAKVAECQVRVNKHDYCAAPGDTYAARLMMDRNTKRVHVAFDPLDPSRIAVLDDDGRLLTMLDRKGLLRMAPDDPATQAQIAAMQQQRGQLTRELKERHASVIREGKSLGVMTPLQIMAAGSTQRPAGPAIESGDGPVDPARITPRKPRSPQPSAAPLQLSPRQAAEQLLAIQKGSK